jgi:hypothetical protein
MPSFGESSARIILVKNLRNDSEKSSPNKQENEMSKRKVQVIKPCTYRDNFIDKLSIKDRAYLQLLMEEYENVELKGDPDRPVNIKEQVEQLMAKDKTSAENDVKKWLALRKKAGRKIDQKTTEVMRQYAKVLDPYGIGCDQYFARVPESKAIQDQLVGNLKKKCRALLKILKRIQEISDDVADEGKYCQSAIEARNVAITKNSKLLERGSGTFQELEEMEREMGNLWQLYELSSREYTKKCVHLNATIDAAWSSQQKIGNIGRNDPAWAGEAKSRRKVKAI